MTGGGVYVGSHYRHFDVSTFILSILKFKRLLSSKTLRNESELVDDPSVLLLFFRLPFTNKHKKPFLFKEFSTHLTCLELYYRNEMKCEGDT